MGGNIRAGGRIHGSREVFTQYRKPNHYLGARMRRIRQISMSPRAAALVAAVSMIIALASVESAPAQAATHWRQRPAVPLMTPGQVEGLRTIFRQGLDSGNRPRSFIKVGDSISWTPLYLQGISCREQRLGKFAELKSTINWFRGLRLPPWASDSDCGGDDPFGRDSAAARPFQFSPWPMLDPSQYASDLQPDPKCGSGETALSCEVRLLRPSIALIMLGTNDASLQLSPSMVRGFLQEQVTWLKERGVIPVLSTIPPRLDSPQREASALSYQPAIAELATEEGVPLINLWKALHTKRMANFGMASDGVHPSTFGRSGCQYFRERCRSVVFTPEALRFGHNRRNLITLQTLDLLRRKIIAPVLASAR